MTESLSPLADAEWDHKIATLPGASFFHSSAWLKVLVDTYGFEPVYQVSMSAGKLNAALPLCSVDSWLTGKRGIGLPFTDECEPLCPDRESFEAVYQGALAEGTRRKWRYLELRGGHPYLGGRQRSVGFFGHDLDLAAGEKGVFDGLESSTRRAVRKSESTPVVVEIRSTAAAMKEFYRLVLLTRRRQGMPPQPFRFFSALVRHVLSTGNGHLFIARSGATPVAGALFCHFGTTAIYKFGASDLRFQDLRANNLVMWRAIQWYLQKGLRRIDFGRTSLRNEGLRRFKLGWGSIERQIDYYRYNLRQKVFESHVDASSGWHNTILRQLRPPMSQLIGHLLYRHLA